MNRFRIVSRNNQRYNHSKYLRQVSLNAAYGYVQDACWFSESGDRRRSAPSRPGVATLHLRADFLRTGSLTPIFSRKSVVCFFTMDIDDLVSKVQLNPPIWDKRLKEHSNSNIVDAFWRKISVEMDIDGKWQCFKEDHGLKLTATVDIAGSFICWCPHKGCFKITRIIRMFDSKSADLFKHFVKPLFLAQGTETQPSELNQPENAPASQPTKRRRMMATNTLYNKKILQLEQRKIDTIQSALQRGPDNDDMMFFKSLLPFVSKIPMEKKLTFRSSIQQVVEEFAFMVGPLQQLSPGTSTGGRPTPQPSLSLSTSSYDSRPPSVDKYNQNYGHQPDTQSFP
ncbi:hypothetical protein J6590_012868 [Homalodisca vitripennis]|nr:hypothetical protein J6590_012868 [Homalodisca vitripennis]